MGTETAKNGPSGRLWPALTIVSLLINLTLAAWLVYDYGRASQRVYDQMLEETWAELQPLYAAMGVDMERMQTPSTFSELLQPLIGMPK